MQIYTELKSDHREVKKLLKQLEKSEETDLENRIQLLKDLKEALVPHARAEEQVLYQRLKESTVKGAADLAFEGFEEHAVVDRLLDELEATSPDDKRWTALVSVVKESLEHHIQEEEEELFPKAQKTFGRETSAPMAEEFLKLKEAYLKEVKAGRTPQQNEAPMGDVFESTEAA